MQFGMKASQGTDGQQLPLPPANPKQAQMPRHLLNHAHEVIGAGLMFLGVLSTIAIVGVAQGVFKPISVWLTTAFGVFAILLPLGVIALGWQILRNRKLATKVRFWVRVLIIELVFISLVSFFHAFLMTTGSDGSALVRSGGGGGSTGFVLATLLARSLGNLPLTSFVLFVALILTAGAQLLPVAKWALSRLQTGVASSSLPGDLPQRDDERLLPMAPLVQSRELQIDLPVRTKPRVVEQAGDRLIEQSVLKGKPAQKIPAGPIVTVKSKKQPVANLNRLPTLPPMSLLKYAKGESASVADVNQLAAIIEQTLRHFGLVGYVKEKLVGPAVTQFGVEPGFIERPGANGEIRQQRVRVGQIAALQNDLALALKATTLRIEAPIPGKALVGIEVPNGTIGTVDLRGIMESEAFQKIKSPLVVAMGKDVAGNETAADLGRMPHLLIAGTTGSGKSVMVSALCVCLSMNNHPDDLKLVMIDPKRVELSRFAGLPHIIGKPESDIERIPAVLRWVTHEMDARYKLFTQIGARNIGDYNEAVDRDTRSGQPTGLEESSQRRKLPRIVVLIDELADLMMQAPVETEKTLCRLAQMARATGIHLVVATQRPSVDVVTGLIKANFPARISFAVASSVDSRVILDQIGAESLLGRGDMLFLNPEKGSPQRLQGCFVSDKEVESLINWWKAQMKTEAADRDGDLSEGDVDEGAYVANKKPKQETPWDQVVAELAHEKAMAGGARTAGGDAGDDALVEKAMNLIRTSGGSVSTSFLQRKLKLGYPRAKALMEELEEMGYVGGASKQAGKGREVRDGEIAVE